MAVRRARAQWDGSFPEGDGTMAFGSGAFEGPYSSQSRFEDGPGTNPEELIGAAHAGCFTMALSLILSEGGNPPDRLETDATVSIVRAGDGFAINRIDLSTRGRVPGVDQAGFERAAQAAKENCPVSKALTGVEQVNVEARLEE